MTADLITSIVTAVIVAIPTILTTVMSNNSNKKLIEYRMELLEEKMDNFTALNDRVTKLEAITNEIREELKRK